MVKAINILAYIHVNNPHCGAKEYLDSGWLFRLKEKNKIKQNKNTDINMHF